MTARIVELRKGVLEKNDLLAAGLRAQFADADVRDARDALAEDRTRRKRVWDALLRRGVHITGARGFVSLQHTVATVDDFVDRFDRALGDL